MEKGNIFNFGNNFLICFIFLSLLIGVQGNGLALDQLFAKGDTTQIYADTQMIEIYPHLHKKSASDIYSYNDKTFLLKLGEQNDENTDLNKISKSKEQKNAEKKIEELQDDVILMKGPIYHEEKRDYEKDMKKGDYGFKDKTQNISDQEERDGKRDLLRLLLFLSGIDRSNDGKSEGKKRFC